MIGSYWHATALNPPFLRNILRIYLWDMLPAFATPLVGAAIALATIYACDVVAHRYGHLPAWLEYPQISLTGIHQPERTVYFLGFALSALVLYVAGRSLGSALEVAAKRAVDAERKSSDTPLGEDAPASPRRLLSLVHQATFAATAAAMGLALQGAVPLASAECAPAFGPADALPPAPECSGAAEGISSMLHALVGANAFFMGSFAHGYFLTSALASPAAPAALRRSWSRKIKLTCLGLALVAGPVVALLQPGTAVLAGRGISQEDEASLEQGGFAQRWAVAWLTAYWASFAIDIHVMLG